MTVKTALVLIDVYNDFLEPKGKIYHRLSESLKESNSIEHIKEALQSARANGIPVYYSLHQQYRDGKLSGFRHSNTMMDTIQQAHPFEEGSWGAEVYEGLEPQVEKGDTVISKHWNQR
jgi:nicotinamidase-related amidase